MNEIFLPSQAIGRFTDNELSEAEEAALLEQAGVNPVLRNEMRLDGDIEDLFSDRGRLRLSEMIERTVEAGRSSKTYLPVLRLAASILILLGLSASLWFILYHTGRGFSKGYASGLQTVKEDYSSLKKLIFTGKDRFCVATPVSRRLAYMNLPGGSGHTGNSAFTPRPEYEFLVGSVTRDVSLVLISPQPRVKCRNDSSLLFTWTWLGSKPAVNIDITDNRGRMVFSRQQLTDMSCTVNLRHLGKGLYYYRITACDQLVTLGSITLY